MKKSKSRLLAISLATAMAVNMFPVTAFALEGGTITGDSTVNSVVLDVEVPTSLAFALDPLALDENAEYDEDAYYQIVSGGEDGAFTITNNTEDAGVLAAYWLDVETAEGVTIAADVDEPFALSATDKELTFGVIASTDGTEFDPSVDASIVAEDSGALDFGFVLTAADGDLDATAFKFYGVLNAYAPWAASDISVSGVYQLIAISPATDTDDDVVTGTAGLVDISSDGLDLTKPDADDFESATSTTPAFRTGTDMTISGSTVTWTQSSADSLLLFNFAGATSGATITNPTGTDVTSMFTINYTAGTVKRNEKAPAGTYAMKLVLNGTEYPFTLVSQ